ncbi:MAG: long-chain fatty acid--CoA ligase [Desulfobacterales bacterium]|nr:long-chain fatty acid--CoA ligase [Desulfobacterales bacterium]
MNQTDAWYEYPYNLVDMFEDSVKKFGDRPLVGMKNADGEYEYKTYGEVAERVDNLRGGLAQLGVDKGDGVGLIIGNSEAWDVIAFATYGRGARLVPMYEKELESTWRYIIKDSGLKVLFVVNEDVYNQVIGWVDEIETLEKVFIIYGSGENSMAAVEEMGQKNPVASVKPHYSEIATLIYTSGTTGAPKGVLLSHGNFTTNVLAASKAFPHVDENVRTLSILPWAHSFGQTGELYFGIYVGGSTGIMGSVDTIVDDMGKVQPTVLIAVPRVFNKVYAGIHNMMRETGGMKEKLFNAAKKEAEKKRETGKASIKFKILDKLVFGKIRDRFGGRLKEVITGSAAMNPEIAQFFIDIGIPTYDCYGLTETTPALTMNTPAANRLGSVGRAIEKVTVVIDKGFVGKDSEDGEIICFGPNVMQGYHNKPEKTAEVIVTDPKLGRGFRTGDRGRLDKDGFLLITGRFKEEYKLENGKYVHPASIEEDINLNSYVLNAMLYGEGKPYNVCLLVPDFETLASVADEMGFGDKSPEDLIKEEKIYEFIKTEVTNHLKKTYGGYEIPKKFILLPEDFSLENGTLTQTMKLKRGNVYEKYQDQLDALYN